MKQQTLQRIAKDNGGVIDRTHVRREQRKEELDTLRLANHKLAARLNATTKYLSEAWTLGACHDKPSFDQLNEWRAQIAENTK